MKYGITRAQIINEFLKTDTKIKKDKIKESETIMKLRYDLMYKCFGIVVSEIDDFMVLIKETNDLLKQLNSKL